MAYACPRLPPNLFSNVPLYISFRLESSRRSSFEFHLLKSQFHVAFWKPVCHLPSTVLYELPLLILRKMGVGGGSIFDHFCFRTSLLVKHFTIFIYFHRSSLCFGVHFTVVGIPGSEGRYLENLIYHGTQLDTINEAVGLAQVTGRGSMLSSASTTNGVRICHLSQLVLALKSLESRYHNVIGVRVIQLSAHKKNIYYFVVPTTFAPCVRKAFLLWWLRQWELAACPCPTCLVPRAAILEHMLHPLTCVRERICSFPCS